MIEATNEVEIGLLGPLLVRVRGRDVPIRAAKQRLLIARLAATPGAAVSADLLVDALWGETPPATVAKNLQVLVGRVRAELGTATIRTEPTGYALDTSACAVDALAFEAHVQRADANAGASAIDELTAALAIWRGDIADEVIEVGAGDVAARLASRRASAELDLLRLRVAVGAGDELVDDLRRALGDQPTNQELVALLVRTLHQLDDVVAARAALAEGVVRLQERGLDPGAELRRLSIEFDVPVLESEDDARAAVVAVLTARTGPLTITDLLAECSAIEGVRVVEALEDLVESGQVVRHDAVNDLARFTIAEATSW